MTATTLTTAQVAEKLNTTPRELRKFLRSDARSQGTTDSLPGKGARYALPGDARTIATMRKKFAKWEKEQAEARAAAIAAKQAESDSETESDDTDDEVIEDDTDD